MTRPYSSANLLVEFFSTLDAVGAKPLGRVAESLGSWERFLAFSPEALASRFAPEGEALQSALAQARRAAERFRPSGRYFSFLDPAYPAKFRQLYDPPLGCYYRGDLARFDFTRPWIAVVGTRRASSYALNFCARLIAHSRPFSPVIVSGLALGIDGMAHRAALAEGLCTVAVLGTSVDAIFPSRHRELAQRVSASGLLLSEIAATTPYAAWHFPKRNRLIAALADAVVVVEAPEKSGALLTADFALELGKEIYVVPGPADSDRNRGGHRLIQQGARLLMDAEEIFRDLGLTPLPKPPAAPSGSPAAADVSVGDLERKLLEIIGFSPCHIDKITDMSHLPTPRVTALLIQLSLKGLVTELPGPSFELQPLAREWLSKSE